MTGRTVRDVDIDAWRLCIEHASVPLGAFNWPAVLGWVLDALEEARAADPQLPLLRNPDGTVAWAPWQQPPQAPICPVCGEPIRWVLDMFSFTTGAFSAGDRHPFTLVHARCAWNADAIRRQAALADEQPA